jgi:glycogen synthase
MQSFPKADIPVIQEKKYCATGFSIEEKGKYKESFQKKYDLQAEKNLFLVGVSTPLLPEENAELFIDMLPGISALGVQLAVRANGSNRYQKIMTAFAEDHKGFCTFVPDADYEHILSASDVMLFFSNTEESLSQLQKGLSNACIPVLLRGTKYFGISDYNPNYESGNAFFAFQDSSWGLFAGLVRAHENFRFPYDWKHIQQSALEAEKKN